MISNYNYKLFDKLEKRIRKDNFKESKFFEVLFKNEYIGTYEFLPRLTARQKADAIIDTIAEIEEKRLKKLQKLQKKPKFQDELSKLLEADLKEILRLEKLEQQKKKQDKKVPPRKRPQNEIQEAEAIGEVKPLTPKLDKSVTKKSRRGQLRLQLLNFLDEKELNWPIERQERFLDSLEFFYGKGLTDITEILQITLSIDKEGREPTKKEIDDILKNRRREEAEFKKMDLIHDDVFRVPPLNFVDEKIIDIYVQETNKHRTIHQYIYKYSKLIFYNQFVDDEFHEGVKNKIKTQIMAVLMRLWSEKRITPTSEHVYMVRLFIPQFAQPEQSEEFDFDKEIMWEYKGRGLEKKTGYGYSIKRRKFKTEKDIRDYIDMLFEALDLDMTEYLRYNNFPIQTIAGFMIEKIAPSQLS